MTLTLADAVDCSRGDLLAAAAAPPEIADQFQATLIWMAEEPLLPGRAYLMKLATQTVSVTVQPPDHQINVDTMAHLAAKTLQLNAIGVAKLATARPIVFEPYARSRELGGFILIDKITSATVAAGMLTFALRRSQNIHRQAVDLGRAHHAAMKAQAPAVIWLTGLSGAGKSPSPTWSRAGSRAWVVIPSCSMATMCGSAATAIWASPTRTGSKTSAAWAKSPS